ncbi:Abi family protein [Rathayibacter agropyri]|uniref:Abi family protein n=1 Tax=Rathayibacter agropyri TaxID=1634927 RepID=UPI001565BFFD|nr:Abi family protein [Rathayibacter agropyri]
MKPCLSVAQQVDLLIRRGLIVDDESDCAAFLTATNYYRFSGYARYFQKAPHLGDDSFRAGTSFLEVRAIQEADEALRSRLAGPLAQVELVLRTHVARCIADHHGAYGRFLQATFYTDIGDREPTVDSCLRDIDRSKDHHILRFRATVDKGLDYSALPVWSAVEAWSFGTLSKTIERGAHGTLGDVVASGLGVGKTGFSYRVRALVYLRNRCAHHGRLWHHSVLDAGPTPNNVRGKAKKAVGQFDPRSVVDILASLDDIMTRAGVSAPVLPALARHYGVTSPFWEGLRRPQSPQDHTAA